MKDFTKRFLSLLMILSAFTSIAIAANEATIAITPDTDIIETAVLGNIYNTTINVKATNLVSDIAVNNISTNNYASDVTVSATTIPMEEAMSETGYNLTITLQPTVIGDCTIYLEFNSESVAEAAYYMLSWTGVDGYELLDPNPDNNISATEVPYFNTFDNYDNDYDGTTVVPANWVTVGSFPFFTAFITGFDAMTGSYYLVADEASIDNRDDRLYTPMFRLSANTEYVISYYLYMPGNSGGGILRDTKLQVSVGTEQDFDFHPMTLQTIKEQSISEWTKQEFTFTPKTSGAYCFAFSLYTDVNYSGQVAIDDFNITSPGLVSRPIANFAIGGVFDVIDSDMLTYPDMPANIVNLSKNGDTYKWVVTYPNGDTLESTEENPEFYFNMSGEYSISLTVTNSRASLSTSKTVMVDYIDYKKDGYSLMTFNPSQDRLLERGLIPSFPANGIEDYDYDFVTGYNRYYKKFAERYELPAGEKVSITSIYTWLAHYRNRAYTSGYDSDKPFEIVIYGETDGKLDENKVFARLSSTLKDVFGNTGVGSGAGEPRSVNLIEMLGEAVEVQGTIYVSFEFADDITISTTDPYMGRSYFALNCIEHSTTIPTIYVKPTAVPENSAITADGNWYRLDELDNTKKGFGAYIILWVNSVEGSKAINSLGETVFALQKNNNDLTVSGTIEGENIIIYNANGMIIASVKARQDNTIIPIDNLTRGIYIVKTNAGTGKFVK